MNRLSTQKRAQIIGCLVEGNNRIRANDKERYPRTPAAAGLTDHVWSSEEIAGLLD